MKVVTMVVHLPDWLQELKCRRCGAEAHPVVFEARREHHPELQREVFMCRSGGPPRNWGEVGPERHWMCGDCLPIVEAAVRDAIQRSGVPKKGGG